MIRNSFNLLIIFFLFSGYVFSQTPTSTPPNQDDRDVVKISTTLIQIDATVTDKKGNVVKNLKPEDFEIYENGKKQEITNFSFVGTSAESQSVQLNQTPQAKNKSAIPLPPIKLKPEQVRRTYALVVDDLGLSFANIDSVKDTLKKFVDEQMQEGDLVAIIRVGSGLGALQSFTSDKRQLYAAISKIRWNISGRVGISSFSPFNRSLLEELGPDPNHPEREAMNERNRQYELQYQYSRQSNIAVGSLGALTYIIRGMSSLPGRKSIMFFSEGFQTIDYSRGNPVQTRVLDTLRSLADLANRSSIILYTFDPRGIIPPSTKDAVDDVSTSEPLGTGNFNGTQIREMVNRDTKDSLRYLAGETGGLAYVDLNKMNNGLEKALDDQNGYYLLGYQPSDETFDPKKSRYNKLEVRIRNPDLKIRYRNGFFAISDEKLKESQTPIQMLNTALTSPFGASDINLDLYSISINTPENKNFIHSFVRIDANDLKFTQIANGSYKSIVQIYAMTFGDNGVPIDQTVKSYVIRLDEKTYQQVLKKGLIYDFPLAVKKPGAYQFRIALLDTDTKKIGSASQFIEVADISKKKLALSNIILKNYSQTDWQKINSVQTAAETDVGVTFSDFISRQFKRGTVVNYAYIIYNAANSTTLNPQLRIQARLFFNGKLLSEGPPRPVDLTGQKDLRRIELSNAVTLGTNLQPGDYILQLIVTDNLAKDKNQIATQSIDFQVIE